jgi:hypothetical protein
LAFGVWPLHRLAVNPKTQGIRPKPKTEGQRPKTKSREHFPKQLKYDNLLAKGLLLFRFPDCDSLQDLVFINLQSQEKGFRR